MRRLLPVLLPLVMLAGCESGPAPQPSGTTAQLRAGFPARGVADTIVIDAIERLPLRAAELIAPDGTTTAASYIDVAASPRIATGQWSAGAPWQNALYGGSGAAALALPHVEAGAALQSNEQLLATASTADIPLPDAVAYRRDWARYHIRLSFGTPPGDVETRELTAPEPPPAAAPPPISPPPGS